MLEREAKKISLEVNQEKTKYLLVKHRAGVRSQGSDQERKMTFMKGVRILNTWKYLSQMITKCPIKSMFKYQLATDVIML